MVWLLTRVYRRIAKGRADHSMVSPSGHMHRVGPASFPASGEAFRTGRLRAGNAGQIAARIRVPDE